MSKLTYIDHYFNPAGQRLRTARGQFWVLLLATVAVAIVISTLLFSSSSPSAGAVELGSHVASPAVSEAVCELAIAEEFEKEVKGRPVAKNTRGYISSESCRTCHAEHYDSWHGSYHRTMTQVPSKETVIADFDNKVLQRSGFQFRFFHENDEYFMELKRISELGDAAKSETLPAQTFKIVLSTGAHHQQAFWCESGTERTLTKIPFIWITKEQRWIPYGSIFMMPSAGLNMHAGIWNSNCIKCHVVGGQPRHRGGKAFDTHVAEFGISCEACHGPGEAHAVAHGADKKSDFKGEISKDKSKPAMTNPATLSHVRSSQICGQCHAVFDFYDTDGKQAFMVGDGMSYRPGDDLLDSRHVFRMGHDADLPIVKEKLRKNPDFYKHQYWSDGMVRVSGREFNGLLETACYQRGTMSCLSCHNMHGSPTENGVNRWSDDQLKVGMRGNAACIECHAQFKKTQALVQHTHHAADSEGSNCYNCHMPHTTLGLMKAMRSHTIDSPDVATTLKTGRPNACNLCHLDKTLAWTGKHLQDWYQIKAPKLNQAEQEIASSVRWLLQGDAGQRAIVGWHFGWRPARQVSGDKWMAPFLAELLDDRYDVVRFVGYHSLKEVTGFFEFDYDFVGSKQSRQTSKRQVLDLWSHAAERPAPASWLLIGEDQQLMKAAFRKLLEGRTDPKMILVE